MARLPRGARRFLTNGLPKCDGRRHRKRPPKVEKGRLNPCLHCPPIRSELHPAGRIAVGFGYAALLRDGKEVWSEPAGDYEDCLPVALATRIALTQPACTWEIIMHGPLHGETYRMWKGKWLLVEKNLGFA